MVASGDLNTDVYRHVADKRQLAATRYEGGGFVPGAVYELRGRLSGVIVSAQGAAIDLEAGERIFHLALPSLPVGIRSGAVVRILIRVDQQDGVLAPLSLVLDREAEAIDPDPVPPAPPPETEVAPDPVQSPAPELAPAAAAWHEYFTQLVRCFNPRLDEAKAGRIAYNILFESTRWQVDPLLVVAVIAAESSFNPAAGSPKGAMGLTQIMPSTARGLGLTNPFNVEQNIYAGVRTIRGHLERNAGGDPWEQFSLALACYNAGSGAVRKYGGVPPFRETHNYIQRVYSIYKALRDSLNG
jgi:hypothetical protein